MAGLPKYLFRETRDTLGRYPNWPLNNPISLGDIGTVHNKTGTIEWRNTLHDIGISISPTHPQNVLLQEELYCTENAIDVDFEHRHEVDLSFASFSFKKHRSIATQGFETSIQQLPLDTLEIKIKDAIKNGLEWNMDWVILTELWSAKGFSLLVSGSSNSSAQISARNPDKHRSFNIANTNLDLKIHNSSKMGYQGIAHANIFPYFQIHRLVFSKSINDYYIRKFGQKTGWWN